jgi:hypothetical protein
MVTFWSVIGWLAVLSFIVNEVLRNTYGIHTNRRLIVFYAVDFVCVLLLLVAVIAIVWSTFLKA